MKLISFFIVVLCFHVCYVNGQEMLLLKTTGKVVIGDTNQITTPGNYNLYVQNGILTERVKVSLKSTADWSDDAFDSKPTIEAVKQSIDKNSHLLDMPSASELVKSGYDVTEMDAKLLQQIEWLWQVVIELKEENVKLMQKISEGKNKVNP